MIPFSLLAAVLLGVAFRIHGADALSGEARLSVRHLDPAS
jgi:hypothetical protein